MLCSALSGESLLAEGIKRLKRLLDQSDYGTELALEMGDISRFRTIKQAVTRRDGTSALLQTLVQH
jgi:hypothetical protein